MIGLKYPSEYNRNIKMTVAYDGTAYSGFQRQADNILTVQGELEKAIQRIIGEDVSLIGSGRTDAGVHARGQIVNFRTNTVEKLAKLQKGLNAVLPEDIVVLDVADVPLDFHSRFDAVLKTYSYHLVNRQERTVFERLYSYHFKYHLNEQKVREALDFLRGEHDFKCFQASGTEIVKTVRNLSQAALRIDGDDWIFVFTSNGFLYHMVRNIVGTLLEIGSERITLAELQGAMESGDRCFLRSIAPACGLCLEKVEYSLVEPEVE